MINRILERLEEELKLADEEKERCARENPLMFDNAKGYSTGIANAISIVKEESENGGWGFTCKDNDSECFIEIIDKKDCSNCKYGETCATNYCDAAWERAYNIRDGKDCWT